MLHRGSFQYIINADNKQGVLMSNKNDSKTITFQLNNMFLNMMNLASL